MKKRSNSVIPAALLFFLICVMFNPRHSRGRDINLDEIYIKNTSASFTRLMQKKLDVYRSINAVFIDRDTIFAGWASGKEVVYLQEVPRLGTNILCRYRVSARKKHEICRIPGVITTARLSGRGNFITIKRFISRGGEIPRGDTVICRLEDGHMTNRESAGGFLDFSISPSGYSLILEEPPGIVEIFPASGIKRILLARSRYNGKTGAGSTTIGFLSADEKSLLLLNGGGGSYRAEIIGKKAGIPLRGITSSAEVFWLDGNALVYRGGFPGYFSVNLIDTARGTVKILLPRSYNTNINLSREAGIVTFLKDQILGIYYYRDDRLMWAGLEGEDAAFSPVGSSFTLLLYGRLFMVSMLGLQKNELELRKYWREMEKEYSVLLTRRAEWENEYSLDYVRRKINVYRELRSGGETLIKP